MNVIPVVGTYIEHPEYGRGKVLGCSEWRNLIRIRFQNAVIKELPLSGSGTAAHGGYIEPRVLLLHFESGDNGNSGCRWRIEFRAADLVRLVHDISTWAGGKARVKGASVILRTVESGRMELIVKGRGRDGRCRWCRTFRSGLKTAVRRDFGRQAFGMEGACPFASLTAGSNEINEPVAVGEA